MPDHPNAFHDQGRVEEVHVAHPVRPPAGRGDLGRAGRGGVGGQDGVCGREPAQGGKDFPLEIQPLGARLNDEVHGLRHGIKSGAEPKPGTGGCCVAGLQFLGWDHLAGAHAQLRGADVKDLCAAGVCFPGGFFCRVGSANGAPRMRGGVKCAGRAAR